MLTQDELSQAEALFIERLRELGRPAPPEFVRDGTELADLLRVSRTKAWEISKRADFNAAAPARALGPKTRLRRRADVLRFCVEGSTR